MYIKKNYLT